MTESDLDFIPRITSQRPGRQWWIIAGCILLGALIGYAMSYMFPAVYEATFKVISNVKLTDDPKISEFMVDTALLHVGELVYAQPLMDKVIAEEKTRGINLTPADLKSKSNVERQITTTFLKVRWTNAETAAQLANTWGKLFYESLEEGARQAVIAEELTQVQTLLQNCLVGIQTPSPEALKCPLNKDLLEQEIAQTSDKIAAAETASLGMYRELRVNSYEEAQVPTAPIRQERGWLIAAGAGIGLIAGLLLTEIILSPSRRSRTR